MIARTVTESCDSPGLMLPHADLRTAAVRAIHATIDGARWAIWLSALRVSRVLSAALVLARDLDATARRWRWLTAALFDPYRPERHYMRGPGPKWREKHVRGAGS